MLFRSQVEPGVAGARVGGQRKRGIVAHHIDADDRGGGLGHERLYHEAIAHADPAAAPKQEARLTNLELVASVRCDPNY